MTDLEEVDSGDDWNRTLIPVFATILHTDGVPPTSVHTDITQLPMVDPSPIESTFTPNGPDTSHDVIHQSSVPSAREVFPDGPPWGNRFFPESTNVPGDPNMDPSMPAFPCAPTVVPGGPHPWDTDVLPESMYFPYFPPSTSRARQFPRFHQGIPITAISYYVSQVCNECTT